MNQVYWQGEAREDRKRTGARTSEVITGILALAALLGGAGCAVDASGEGSEPVESVSQEDRITGGNGIPPAVLAGGYLQRSNTDNAGITTPVDAKLIKLCETFDGVKCLLKQQWAHWVNPNQADPPDPDSVLRRHLLSALIQGAMPPEVAVSVGPGDEIPGMFGLFLEWAEAPLAPDAQELMSAFIAMKVNALGATVPIGIVGPGPGEVAPEPIDDPTYHFQEAVFAGNLFGQSSKVFACTGSQISGGGVPVGLEKRICSQPGNPCNIKGLGPCANVCGAWAGVGTPTGEHCVAFKDPGGVQWLHPLTTYLTVAEPQ